MVQLSSSDELVSSYSKTKQLVFASLTRQQQIKKDKIENGSYGYGLKFILEFNKELNKFNDITLNGYKLIGDKFKALCSHYRKEPIEIENDKKDMNITYTNVVDETLSSNAPNEHKQHKVKSKKVKKRTLDEADLTHVLDTDSNVLNQTKTKKTKKKLKAKKLSKITDKLDTTAELVAKNLLNQSIKSEKLSILVTNNTQFEDAKHNPSKKVRLSTEDENTTQVSKKSAKATKKKRKSSKKKSSAVSQKKASVQSQDTASFLASDCLTSTKFEFNEAKTPMRNNLIKLQSILESNTKTIKAEKRIPSVHASGKVKQMVELVEARMKNSVNNTPTTVVKQTKSQHSNNTSSVLNQTKKLNEVTTKKLRSSIDERKKRISNSKNEIKRQSTKRINAFLNDLAASSSSVVKPQSATKLTNQPVTNPVSTVKKKLNYQQVDLKIKEEQGEQADEAVNTKENRDPAKKLTIGNLIASSSSISQQYRLKHTSSVNSEHKNSFNKFLERNTPNKLTKIELDEKRKVELMCKEEKDQKRLQEREKQLLEKIEQNKKKREEKMKKIDELKIKQQEDVQKKKEELEAKQREAEENKKRLLEEKRKEEFEKQRAKEQQRIMTAATMSVITPQANILGSAQKVKPFAAVKPTHASNVLTPAKQPFAEQTNKPNKVMQPPGSAIKMHTIGELAKTPVANKTPHAKMPMSCQKPGTPYAAASNAKKKLYENYDICDLNSGDDTDDDEEPSKPIPEWAKEANFMPKALAQCHQKINYTKLFKASCQNEIILENIFKIKRKKFTERSSSAIWNSPPVWRTNGINGDESFRQLHNL